MSIRVGLRLSTGKQRLAGLAVGVCAAVAWLFADFAVLGIFLLAVALVLLFDRSRVRV